MWTDRTPVTGLVHPATPTTLVPVSKPYRLATSPPLASLMPSRSALVIVNFPRRDCPSRTAIICRSAGDTYPFESGLAGRIRSIGFPFFTSVLRKLRPPRSKRASGGTTGGPRNRTFQRQHRASGSSRRSRSVNGPSTQSYRFRVPRPPAVTHEQGTRIAYAAFANVKCRPRNEFHGLALGLVAKRTFEKSTSLRDIRGVGGTRDRSCQSANQPVDTFGSRKATSQFGEQLGVVDEFIEWVGVGSAPAGRGDW